MADIELVINIPQKVWEDCIFIPSFIEGYKKVIQKAFENAEVLPEHHGRLGDLDEIYNRFEDNCAPDWILDIIDAAPTIIPSTYEEENNDGFSKQKSGA